MRKREDVIKLLGNLDEREKAEWLKKLECLNRENIVGPYDRFYVARDIFCGLQSKYPRVVSINQAREMYDKYNSLKFVIENEIRGRDMFATKIFESTLNEISAILDVLNNLCGTITHTSVREACASIPSDATPDEVSKVYREIQEKIDKGIHRTVIFSGGGDVISEIGCINFGRGKYEKTKDKEKDNKEEQTQHTVPSNENNPRTGF